MDIRGTTIACASRKKKNNVERENEIVKTIKYLEEYLDSNNNSDKDKELKDYRNSLENLRAEKMKGIMLRSKAKWCEEGEKPTRYFCSLEKRNYICKLVNKLNCNGTIIHSQDQILEKQQSFYKTLYSSKIGTNTENLLNEFLHENNIKQLSDEQKDICDGPIRKDEIKEVIRNIANNKTPGSDGFPVEFWKFFWINIGHFLIRALDEAFENGELSFTQKQGVITCLHKDNKPREFLKNWRPISLLNTDYKILTGILARRLKLILPSIIGQTQKGFLKERFIGENTRLVYDIMDYLNSNNMAGMLLLVDFEKAFDTLEWSYIKAVLNKYNFGNTFTRWFDIIYKNSNSCVINNGKISESFELKAGGVARGILYHRICLFLPLNH